MSSFFKFIKDKFIQYKEGILYLFFGALTTLISLVTFFLFYKLVFNSTHEQLSTIFSWIISVSFAFITNKIFVFESKRKHKMLIVEALSFFIVRLFTLGIDSLYTYIFLTNLEFNAYLVKISDSIVIIVLNFLLSKFIVFYKEKNILKNNYHAHLSLCHHAKGEVIDYVKKAKELGMKEVGISDHGPFPNRNDGIFGEVLQKFNRVRMSYDEFYNNYLPQFEHAKNAYPKFKILKGLEVEYFKEYVPYLEEYRKSLDYLILGVHFYSHNGDFVNTFVNPNYENLSSYVDTVIEALDTKLFPILAHPDVFMKNYKSVDGSRNFDDVCEKESKRLIEYCVKNHIIMEINVNGIISSHNNNLFDPLNYYYPHSKFWNIVKEYKDALVMIGGDFHNYNDLDIKEIRDAYDFAKLHKLRIINKIEF